MDALEWRMCILEQDELVENVVYGTFRYRPGVECPAMRGDYMGSVEGYVVLFTAPDGRIKSGWWGLDRFTPCTSPSPSRSPLS